jgi:outer membrane immunogenic protein
MKKLLLTSVALMGLTASAMAADLPRRVAPAPLPIPVAPLFSWTGFYAGINVGYGFSGSNDECDDDFFSPSCRFGGFDSSLTSLTVPNAAGVATPINIVGGLPTGLGLAALSREESRRDGFVGGGQIGYNWQFTPGSGFVMGIEADAQYAGFRREDECEEFGGFGCLGLVGGGFTGLVNANPVLPIGLGAGISPFTPNVALYGNAFNELRRAARSDIEWFGTVRGRLGYAVDRLLLYVTGGLAYTSRDNGDGDNPFLLNSLGLGVTGPEALPANFFVLPGARALAIANAQPTFSFLDRRTYSDFGWTVGGGIEWAPSGGLFGLSEGLTVKIEGLYVSFDSELRRNNFVGGRVVGVSDTGAPITATNLGLRRDRNDSEDFAVIRVGLNWKFGGYAPAPVAVAPVAARY